MRHFAVVIKKNVSYLSEKNIQTLFDQLLQIPLQKTKSIIFGSSPLKRNWKHFVNNIEKIYVSHIFMKHSSSCQKTLFPPLEILLLVNYNQSTFSLRSYHCKIVLTYLISLHQNSDFRRPEIYKL